MTASAIRHRRSRVRAPPPTPIRTGKGTRSAAVDDRVLAEFLDNSTRIPDLTLPRSHFASPHAPPAIVDEINVTSLDEGDIVAESRVVKAVRETGAFRMSSSSVSIDEVKEAIEAAKSAFAIDDEIKEKHLSKFFRRRDVVEEEFYWTHPVNPNPSINLSLKSSFSNPNSYQTLSTKLNTIATKLESISASITKSLNYPSQFAKTPLSVLCITQFSVNQSSLTWNELGDGDQPSDYDLCLHIAPQNQDFRLCSHDGSNFYNIPSGSALVTVGKQLQDLSNGEYKSAIGEVLYELSEDPNPFYSLEFFYNIENTGTGTDTGTSTSTRGVQPNVISIKQQILILAFILELFNLVFFWFGK